MQRARMSETLEAIGDRVSPERMVERRKAAVGQGFKRLRESVMGSSEYEEPMSTRVRERAGGVAHQATDAAQSAAERVQHAPEMIAERARGNPMAAGFVAFGAGVLLATLFPETRTEQRLVDSAQPQMQRATEELKGAGRELMDDAKQQAQQATQEVRAAGSEAASNVAEQTRSSAQEVAQEARNR